MRRILPNLLVAKLKALFRFHMIQEGVIVLGLPGMLIQLVGFMPDGAAA